MIQKTPPLPSDRWHVTMRGDIVFIQSATARDIQPEDWRERLVSFIKLTAIACVGAKRLAGNEKKHIFSMGEMLIHPKGYHHHGGETNFRCYRFPEEVDVIAGGVMAVDRKAFEAVHGASLLQGELGRCGWGWRCGWRGIGWRRYRRRR